MARVVLTCHFLVLWPMAAGAATFEVRPVSANVQYSISGNQITLPQGLPTPALIDFDVYASGWSAQGSLQGAQVTPLVSGGTGGGIAAYAPACTTHAQCPPQVGPGSQCLNSTNCGFGSFDTTRPDFIFQGTAHVTVSAIHAAGLSVTSPANSIVDSGSTKYLATMRLQVSPGSSGTFTVNLTPSGNPNPSFWSNQLSQGFFPTRIPATVVFDSAALGIPAVGAWGALAMVLSIACAATIRLGRACQA